ncbi:enoyl-CoA hydratase/isomerase family protein [Sinimarinibacterium sp. CAU 1509]|uniref:enoyl-CoA hydratase/isomerase family protein n=1 Tax=Sinimarinibacterium sp. CAU 1509 TaxID=2562283 RepID=UPI0010ABC982|nr:enoyl-CoA hydratase/isomerase family protein [Sinimarinibacterium sp. CAU 1509]TJY64884.1 enoyl-CoA hydratase/isomerase family protein [Sinimarinibacterium sp. CAU 1509]
MASELQPLSAILLATEVPGAGPELSPLSASAYIALDLDAASLDAEAQTRVAAWIRSAPGPVLGVGGTAANRIVAEACDAHVVQKADLAPLIANIQRSPIAAAVMVRLLRTTEGLAIEDALLVESLAYSTLQTGPEYQRWLAEHRAAAPFEHRDAGPAVLIERDRTTLTLSLNRPSNRNGMTVEMRDALVEALQLVQTDPDIERAVLRGEGKCFSTGGDLTEFGTAPDPATAHAVRTLRLPGRELAACASRVEAQLHGACIGSGIEFPAFAGRVVADASTHFQLPELKFGLIPGAGGCVSIPRRIGRQRTAWWVLSGQRINVRQALDWGLIDAIV